MMNSTGDIATAPERYGSDICITNLARSDSAVTTDTISVGQDSARSSASSGSASPTMCELPAREELPAAEDAALVLLAFCNSAGSRRGAVVPRPASSPAARNHSCRSQDYLHTKGWFRHEHPRRAWSTTTRVASSA